MLSSIDIQNLKQLLNFHEQIVEYLYLLIVPWQNLSKLSFFSKETMCSSSSHTLRNILLNLNKTTRKLHV